MLRYGFQPTNTKLTDTNLTTTTLEMLEEGEKKDTFKVFQRIDGSLVLHKP